MSLSQGAASSDRQTEWSICSEMHCSVSFRAGVRQTTTDSGLAAERQIENRSDLFVNSGMRLTDEDQHP